MRLGYELLKLEILHDAAKTEQEREDLVDQMNQIKNYFILEIRHGRGE